VKFTKRTLHYLSELRLAVKIALALFGLVLLVGTTVEVTGSPRFCNSCHIMNDYCASWKQSKHSEVNCLLCHLRPGLKGFVRGKLNGLTQAVDCIAGRFGTKPNAAVQDSSCLRKGCHESEPLKTKPLDLRGIQFTHEKHMVSEMDGIRITCNLCHSHFEGQDHFTVNKDVCYTCHFLEGSNGEVRVAQTSCRTCHLVPSRTIQRGLVSIDHKEFVAYKATCERSCHKNEVRQASHVDDNVCLNCHNFRRDGHVDGKQLHAEHTGTRHKVECFACHGETRHARKDISAVATMMDCRNCHSDTHGVQQSLYSASHPMRFESPDRVLSPMFLTHVECTGCHTERVSKGSGALDSFGTVARAVPAACDQCHAPGTGQQYIPLWQGKIKALHAQTSARLARLEQRLEGPALLAQVQEARPRLDQVRATLDAVSADASWGVHNFKYTEKLLLDADATMSELTGRVP
jgi:hypothetical protein